MAVHYLITKKKKTTKKRRRKSTNPQRNYADLKRRLNVVHKFSFNLPQAKPTKKDIELITRRKTTQDLFKDGQLSNKQIKQYIHDKARDLAISRKLSPQQKASITKLWDGTATRYGQKNSVKLVEKGQAQFVTIKNPSQKRILARMKKTNKGVYVFEKDVKIVKRGKGKNFRLELQRIVPADKATTIFRRKEQFFPFPPDVIIIEYINKLAAKYKPDSIAIGVMSARGNVARSSVSGFDYIEDAIEDYDRKGIKHPFSGVYFFWY